MRAPRYSATALARSREQQPAMASRQQVAADTRVQPTIHHQLAVFGFRRLSGKEAEASSDDGV